MKILGRHFVFGRTIDEALKRAAPERAQGLSHSFDMLGEAARDLSPTPSATPKPIATRSTASPRKPKGGFAKSPGISVKLSALHPRYEWSHADEAKAAILPVLRELALKAQQGRRPFHHRRRGGRPARAVDGHDRGAARRRRAVRERLGRVRARDPGLSEARACRCATGSSQLARAHRPQADGPAGQGRLLGHRDQGRAGRRACRTIRCSPARSRPTSPISPAPRGCSRRRDAIYPAFATHNANTIGAVKALAGKTPFEFQRLHGMGEGLYEEARQAREGDRRPADAGADLRAGRQPQGAARLSRPPPARERRQFLASSTASPTSSVSSTSWSAIRSPTSRRSSPSAIRRSRCPTRSFRRRAPQQRRRRPQRPAGARAVARAAESARSPAAGPRSRRSERARAGRSSRRTTTGSRSATTFEATADEVDRMVRAGHAAQVDWDALGGEARAKLLDRAADLFEEHARGVLLAVHARGRQDLGRRGARSARGGRFPALLRVRSAAPVHQAAAASRARPASRTSCACTAAGCSPAFRRGISRWRSSPAWSSAPLAAGNAVIAKPAGQTPLIGALGDRADAPGGHSQGHRPARARLRQGRRRNADRASAARGRRLHRLDRDRAHDQPHAGRARRADHPVHRRNRRPECDDRRQLGSARAGHARRHFLGVPERRPALLGAARAVRPGRRRRRHDRDDRRRDGGADGRRSRATSRPTSAR